MPLALVCHLCGDKHICCTAHGGQRDERAGRDLDFYAGHWAWVWRDPLAERQPPGLEEESGALIAAVSAERGSSERARRFSVFRAAMRTAARALGARITRIAGSSLAFQRADRSTIDQKQG
eukprot:gene18430-biopygen3940